MMMEMMVKMMEMMVKLETGAFRAKLQGGRVPDTQCLHVRRVCWSSELGVWEDNNADDGDNADQTSHVYSPLVLEDNDATDDEQTFDVFMLNRSAGKELSLFFWILSLFYRLLSVVLI